MGAEQAWRQFAHEVGGEFIVEDGLQLGTFRLFASHKVVAKVKQWIISLNSYTTGGGYSGGITYTRITAPDLARDGFRFEVHRRTAFGKLGKRFFGMQDSKVGYPDFDRDFIIKGNDQLKVRALLANEKIRSLIPPSAAFRFQADGETLHFAERGVIANPARLQSLYLLFAETLDELHHMGSISAEAPGLGS